MATGFLLPQELVDRYIDYLHDDPTALRTCSTVCHQWLPASSFHLFGRLKWPPCQHGRGSEGLRSDVSCKCHLQKDFNSLGDLVSMLGSSPRIASHVRELLVHMVKTERNDVGDAPGLHHGSPRVRWLYLATSPRQLLDILDLTLHLESLEIIGLNFAPDASLVIPSVPRRIRTLDVLAPAIGMDYRLLLNLLLQFSHISTLSVRRIASLGTSTLPLVAPEARPLQVDALELGLQLSTNGCDFLSALCDHTDCTSIRSLNISDVARSGDGLSAVLHKLLDNCTSLCSLACCDGYSPKLFSYSTPHRTLRHLQYSITCLYERRMMLQTSWPGLLQAVQSPLYSTIRDLELKLTFVRALYGPPGILSDGTVVRELSARFAELDWAGLAAYVAQLRSLAIRVSVGLALRAPTDGQPLPQANTELQETCQTDLEAIVRSKLPLSSTQVVHLHVSISVN